MSKIAFQKQSVFFRLFSVLFLVSIILILLYVCVIECSGIVNQLCGSKIDIIDNIVETRKNTIENQMVAGWADYESMEDAITELENLNDAGSENEVQVKRAEILLNLLGNTSGTGIFYVPLEENDKNGYDTLYFCDLNPESYSRTNADIYGEYGNAAIMKTLGITMDVNWKAYADKNMLTEKKQIMDAGQWEHFLIIRVYPVLCIPFRCSEMMGRFSPYSASRYPWNISILF